MKQLTLSKKVHNLKEEQYGRLLVLEFSHIDSNKGRNAYWKCLCDCGNVTVVKSSHLKNGSVKSCGCLAKELSAKRIKLIHNTGQHLYFIRCNEFIKIGRANDVNQRLSQLSAANPYPVELIKEMKNQGYREKEMHEKFKDKLHSGEWFKLDGCEVVDIG